jgi:hypothetical protein
MGKKLGVRWASLEASRIVRRLLSKLMEHIGLFQKEIGTAFIEAGRGK